MDVKPVSNNTPAFRGYIGPNLKQYITGTIQREVNIIVNKANTSGKTVETEGILTLKEYGKSIINKFEKYIAKTNKKTELDLNDTDSSYMRFNIKNPIAPKKDILIYPSDILKKTEIQDDYIRFPEAIKDLKPLKKSDIKDLQKLEKYAKHLENINPKAIDKIFLDTAENDFQYTSKQATGFLDKLLARKKAKQIDKFANEMGQESTASIRVEEYFKTAKEFKLKLQKQEELKKANQKIADDILNS